MGTEDSVQVLTGQKIRTVKMTKSIDGVATDVDVECVALIDMDGNVFDLNRVIGAIEALRQEVRELHDSFKSANGM